MEKILIADITLRDGNNVFSNIINRNIISKYLTAADHAKIDVLEIGHGSGLGGSSLLFGESGMNEERMFATANSSATYAQISAYVIPGITTIKIHMKNAIENGVKTFRIGTNCTYAAFARHHIEYAANNNCKVWGELQMCHIANVKMLIEEGAKLVSYGAKAIILSDSGGTMEPEEVINKITALREHLPVPIGFHGINNLGLAVINSIAAMKAGASIIYTAAKGIGGGAGNAPLEVVFAILRRMGHGDKVTADFLSVLKLSALANELFNDYLPYSSPETIVSGIKGLHAQLGYSVKRIAENLQVDALDILSELGRRKSFACFEDTMLEVAQIAQATNKKYPAP
jgi:4-hydroxy 2-oxovalerate aldolase